MPHSAVKCDRRFIGSIHVFRSFAIVNIVLVHALSGYLFLLQNSSDNDTQYQLTSYVVQVLFHGSTIYFALISGALFTAVLHRDGWVRFFQNKLTNVLAPYTLLTLIFSAVYWEVGHGLVSHVSSSFTLRFLYNLLLGRAVFGYWYIPVILLLFILTPLLAMLVYRRPFHNAPTLLIVVLPLVVSRTGVDLTLQTVIYYAGAYTAGMWLGTQFGSIVATLRQWRWGIVGVAAVSSALLLALFLREIEWIGSISIRQSLFYLQKLSLSALILVAAQRYQNRVPAFLDILARYALAIFFLHFLFLDIALDTAVRLAPQPQVQTVLVLGFLAAVFATALSLLTSRGLQYVAGRRSRLLIGA